MSDQDNYFSSQYQYKIKKTSDENQGRYQLGDYWLIQYHILRCNIRRLVEQTVRRITDDILGVKGLSGMIICVLFDNGDERYMFSEAYLSFNVCYHNKEVLFKSKEVGL